MTENRQYKISEKARANAKSTAVVFLCLALGGATAVLIFFDSWTVGQLFLFACMAGFFSAQLTRHYLFLKNTDRNTVMVDDYGIQSLDPGQKLARLSWEEITEIQIRPVLKRLDLIGPPGFRPIRLAYQLEGFEDLVDLLVEKGVVADLSHSSRESIRFQNRTWHYTLLIMLAAGGMNGLVHWLFRDSSLSHILVDSLIGGTIMHLFMAGPREGPRRLCIDQQHFEVHQGFTILKVDFSTVTKLSLIPKKGQSETVETIEVHATLVTGREVSLCPKPQEVFEVYQAIASAWQRNHQSLKSEKNRTKTAALP